MEAQAGFRKNMGTIDNIFVLHGVINHLLNENKNCMQLSLIILKHLITWLEKICGINS